MGQPALLRRYGSTALSSHLLACGTCWLRRGARTQLRTILGLRFAHCTCSLSGGALASAIRDAGRPIPAWPPQWDWLRPRRYQGLSPTTPVCPLRRVGTPPLSADGHAGHTHLLNRIRGARLQCCGWHGERGDVVSPTRPCRAKTRAFTKRAQRKGPTGGWVE